MDKPHKRVVTSSPVAIKAGQTRVHAPEGEPWHINSERVDCPKCETVFHMTQGFPKASLLAVLETHHKNQEAHPDYIASEPDFTSLAECDCRLSRVKTT
jgi:hypothetical protein